MTHTLISKGLNLLAAFALISGIGLSVSQTMLYASLSGQGSTLVDLVAQNNGSEELHSAPMVMTADTYQSIDARIQLVIGILLIVLGLFIHGLARARDERNVHITVKPSSKKRRTMWYWMEMRF